MKIDWLKIAGTVAIAVVVSVVLFGAYQYYFKKPVPVINNYTVQSGGTITQNPEKKGGHWAVGGIVGKDFYGGHITYLF